MTQALVPEQTAAPPKPRTRWRLLTAAKVVLSAGLIGWVLSRANLRDVFGALSGVDPLLLLLAFLSQLVGTWLGSLRWRQLLSAQGVDLSHGLLFRSCMVAHFFKQFLPSTVGGDAVRAYDSWRAGASKTVAVMALTVDRLTGLLALALFAVVALALSRELTARHPTLTAGVVLGAAALVLAVWVLFLPSARLLAALGWACSALPRSMRSVFDKVLTALTAYRGDTRALARVMLLSVLLQVNVVAFYFLLARSLGFGIPYHSFFVIVPIAIVVMLAPLSINGIGVREGIFVFLLGEFGVGASQAVAFAWLEYGLFLSYGLIGGVIYALKE